MTALPAQLFLEILADRKYRPAALRLHLTADDSAWLLALLGSERFSDLAKRMPCLLGESGIDGLPDPLVDILCAAGCKVPDAGSVHRIDVLSDTPLPAGARYLAGDWTLQPPPKPGNTQTASRALALQLLQLVAAEADTHEIEAIFRHDPTMSYHLLRLVNSLNRGGRRITSFGQAILVLGRRQLRRWLNLMLFAARKDDPRAPMLLARVSIRAHSMELLARASGLDKVHQEAAFMAGMFSLLGVLFGMPLVDVLRPLDVGAEIADAVLHEQGDLGAMLAVVAAAERADAPVVAGHLTRLGIDSAAFGEITLAAAAWMLDLIDDASGEDRG